MSLLFRKIPNKNKKLFGISLNKNNICGINPRRF